jgi:hypothetical protein
VIGGLKPARSGTWQARMGEFSEEGIQIIQKSAPQAKKMIVNPFLLCGALGVELNFFCVK